jgi:hypothetical protein
VRIPDTVIVMDVLSARAGADVHGVKFEGYFSFPSLQHDLILDADRRAMIHHRRALAGAIESRILGSTRPASKPRSPRSSQRTELGAIAGTRHPRVEHYRHA